MTSAVVPDPYAVLGVEKNADISAIKSAHRKLVLKCHPDKIRNELDRDRVMDTFERVQQAYELLSDPTKRAIYDSRAKLIAETKERAQFSYRSGYRGWEPAKPANQSGETRNRHSAGGLGISAILNPVYASEGRYKDRDSASLPYSPGISDGRSLDAKVAAFKHPFIIPPPKPVIISEYRIGRDFTSLFQPGETRNRHSEDRHFESKWTKKYYALPLHIHGKLVSTVADSGADENAISIACADELGLEVRQDPDRTNTVAFKMATGKVIKSCGVVHTTFSFARGSGKQRDAPVFFRVFPQLAVPILMGRRFLEATETLSRFKDRLKVTIGRMASAIPRIFHLSPPKKRFRCLVDGTPVYANADTGAEMNLASPQWAAKHHMQVRKPDPGCESVLLADGSHARISGQFSARFQVYNEAGMGHRPQVYQQDFFILEGLTSDVLLCEDLLFDVDAFAEYQDSFIELHDPGIFADINLVTWLKKGEEIFLRVTRDKRARNKTADAVDAAFKKSLDDNEAHEQYLRQCKDAEINRLPEPEKTQQRAAENQRREIYDAGRTERIQMHQVQMAALRQQNPPPNPRRTVRLW